MKADRKIIFPLNLDVYFIFFCIINSLIHLHLSNAFIFICCRYLEYEVIQKFSKFLHHSIAYVMHILERRLYFNGDT